MIDFDRVYESAGATIAKCHSPDGVNNRCLIPHSSGDGCPRSKCLWPPDSHPLAATGCSLGISSSYGDLTCMGLGFHPISLMLTQLPPKRLCPQIRSHSKYKGLGLQQLNLGDISQPITQRKGTGLCHLKQGSREPGIREQQTPALCLTN